MWNEFDPTSRTAMREVLMSLLFDRRRGPEAAAQLHGDFWVSIDAVG
jgi:hypothetical protein